MRRIREVLRLHFEAKLNERQIAKICSVGKGTVRRYLKRIAAAGLSWPLPADLDDATLEHRMFPPPPPAAPGSRPLPDFAVLHKELKSRQNVTLQLLWEEYYQAHPEGFNYSWFCELYRNWAHNLDIVLRQEHRAGEKTFVDHAGQTAPVTNPRTGEVREAYIFVAVLGASSYTYAEATWTRDLWDWCGSHVRAFEYFQGVSRLIVPDNWKSVLFAEWKKAHVNLDYRVELEGHYYSTPYQLVGKEVEIRYTAGTVEILYRGKRVASHARNSKAHAHSTLAEHRPKSHQQYLEWTPTRIIEWAGKAGPFTARLVEAMLAEKPHPACRTRISCCPRACASGFRRSIWRTSSATSSTSWTWRRSMRSTATRSGANRPTIRG
jgi:transposase